MIHQFLDNAARHVLHDEAVDSGGDDGDRDDVPALVNDVANLLVLDAHNILTVDLQQVVVH